LSFRPKFGGVVKNGEIVYDPACRLTRKAYLAGLEGQRVDEIIQKEGKDISKGQRGYYWGVVVKLIAEELGCTKEETHEILQAKFFVYYNDKGLPYVQSLGLSGNWPAKELAEKIDEIRHWAQTFFASDENPGGLFIPLPGDIDVD
jgi:hypothetical protein